MPIPASALSLYAPRSADLVPDATLAMDTEDTDPDYAVENAQTDDLEDTARSTGVIATITITLASPQEVVAISLFNTNATEIGLRSGSGLDIPVPVESRMLSGHLIHPWLWFGDEDEGERTSNVFEVDLEKTGSAPLEVGRIALLTELNEFLWLPGPEFGLTRFGGARNRTRGGKVHRRLAPWAPVRTGVGVFQDLDDYQAIRDLEASSNGLGEGFVVIPRRTRNDAMLVQLAEDALRWREFGGSMDLRLPLEEFAAGLPPGPD